jgi:hypothetical protein
VEAAQVGGATGGALRKLALLSGAGILALAFATPARADDQSPPPPLMVGKSAMIAPDEPDATVAADTESAETVSDSVPVADSGPTRAVADDGCELAAKPEHLRPAVRARVHLTHVQPARRALISSRVRPVRSIRPHHAVKTAPHAASRAWSRWYQLAPRQYRHPRAGSRTGRWDPLGVGVQNAPVGSVAPRPTELQTTQNICELRARKCLELCAPDVSYTVSQNTRWIRVCIYSPYTFSGLDRVHALLLQRLWALAADTRRTASATQYQCLSTQYQGGTCVDEPTLGVRVPRRSAPHAKTAGKPTVSRAVPRGRTRVLAAVATRERRPVKVVLGASSPPVAAEKSRRAPEVAPSREKPDRSGSGWFLRSLLALIGVAMLAFLLTALAEMPRVDAAFAEARARLGSKGLSSSRIDLRSSRAPEHRHGGISYRD